MKLRPIAAAILALLCTTSYAAETTTKAPTVPAVGSKTAASISLNNETAKVSYSIGMDLGQNFKAQAVTIDVTAFARGMQDALNGTTPLMTTEQREATLKTFQQKMRVKQASEIAELAEKNKKEGEAFQAENKKKPGVKILADGLQYKVLKEGKGPHPTDQDVVTVNYAGTLTNGQEFDSSYKRNKPAMVPLVDVIPGWQQALKLMSAGSTWEIVVPPSLAYGDRGIAIPGSPIGPNQTLVFKIELISFSKPGATTEKGNSKK